jgi:hypothetical protein
MAILKSLKERRKGRKERKEGGKGRKGRIETKEKMKKARGKLEEPPCRPLSTAVCPSPRLYVVPL